MNKWINKNIALRSAFMLFFFFYSFFHFFIFFVHIIMINSLIYIGLRIFMLLLSSVSCFDQKGKNI